MLSQEMHVQWETAEGTVRSFVDNPKYFADRFQKVVDSGILEQTVIIKLNEICSHLLKPHYFPKVVNESQSLLICVVSCFRLKLTSEIGIAI